MNICSKCNSIVKVNSTLTNSNGIKVRQYICTNCKSIYYVKVNSEVIQNDEEAEKIYKLTLHEKALANLSKGAD